MKRALAWLGSLSARRWHAVSPLLAMAILYWLSSIPGKQVPGEPYVYQLLLWLPPAVENFLHIPAYFALGWAWRWSLEAWLPQEPFATIIAFFLSSGYGVLDEWHQSFVPDRDASLSDLLRDVVGVLLALWLFKIASRLSGR